MVGREYEERFGASCTEEDGKMVRMEIYVHDPSNRAIQWMAFALEVLRHIEEYTVPQYGDFPHDQMTTAKESDILHDIQRYINRFERNARGDEEQRRDLFKMAHYACILEFKKQQFSKRDTPSALDVVESAFGSNSSPVHMPPYVKPEVMSETHSNSVDEPCPLCRGVGYIGGQPCPACGEDE